MSTYTPNALNELRHLVKHAEQLRRQFIAGVRNGDYTTVLDVATRLRELGENASGLLEEVNKEAQRRERQAEERKQQRVELRHDLARRGWYVGGAITEGETVTLIAKITSDDYEGAEDVLIGYARGCIDSVERYAREHWPDRAPVIFDALEAHQVGKYTLTIPALLIQAEGLSREILDASIFSTDRDMKDVPVTRKKAEELRRRFAFEVTESNLYDPGTLDALLRWTSLDYLLPVLEILHGIAYNTYGDVKNWRKERMVDQTVSPLNRHVLMHGDTSVYATEANSLRVIAMLQYLTELDAARRAYPDEP